MDDDATTPPSNASDADVLMSQAAQIVKAIGDIDHLVRLLGRGLPQAKPWQRQLAKQLGNIERLVQVLRMTLVMNRPDVEVGDAAAELGVACRQIEATVMGARADHASRAAVRLMAGLGQVVTAGIHERRRPVKDVPPRTEQRLRKPSD